MAADHSKLCIAYRNDGNNVYSEIGAMVADETRSMFSSVDIVEDGDVAALDADIIMLLGDCLQFNKFPGLLGSSGKRPETVLWQLDPLFPPGRPASEEGLCLRYTSLGSEQGIVSTLKRIATKKLLRYRLWNNLDAADLGSYERAGKRYSWLKENLSAGWLDNLLVSTPNKSRFLSEKGISAAVVPFGYHHSMGADHGRARDIDVLFFGTTRHRRRHIIDGLKAKLARNNVTLLEIKDECFGERREHLLNRAKVALNVHNHPWDYPGIRFVRYMACGSMLLTENINDPAPYISGEHFVESELDAMADAIEFYVKNDEMRQKITSSAREFVRREHTLKKSVERIFSTCKGIR